MKATDVAPDRLIVEAIAKALATIALGVDTRVFVESLAEVASQYGLDCHLHNSRPY